MRQPTRPFGQVDEVLVEFARPVRRRRHRPTTRRPSRRGPRRGRCSRARPACSSAISRIHAPSRPTAGSSSTSAGDQIRARRREVQRDRAAERMADHQHGAGGLGVEQRGQRGDVGVDRPRRLPRRPAVAEQIGCGDGDVGQVPGGQGLPSAGRARSGRGSARTCGAVRPGRSGTRAGSVRSRPSMLPAARTAATCRTPVVSCPACPHRTPQLVARAALTEPGAARHGAGAGWPGHGQEQPAGRDRGRAHRRRAPIRNRFCC